MTAARRAAGTELSASDRELFDRIVTLRMDLVEWRRAVAAAPVTDDWRVAVRKYHEQLSAAITLNQRTVAVLADIELDTRNGG